MMTPGQSVDERKNEWLHHEQGVVAQVLGLDQRLRRDVHLLHLDGFLRLLLRCDLPHFDDGPCVSWSSMPGARSLATARGGRSWWFCTGHDLRTEYDLRLRRRPAPEVQRVDRAVVARVPRSDWSPFRVSTTST